MAAACASAEFFCEWWRCEEQLHARSTKNPLAAMKECKMRSSCCWRRHLLWHGNCRCQMPGTIPLPAFRFRATIWRRRYLKITSTLSPPRSDGVITRFMVLNSLWLTGRRRIRRYQMGRTEIALIFMTLFSCS